jgi:hypothetical protein
MSHMPSFEAPNAANESVIDRMEDTQHAGRLRRLAEYVLDRANHVGHIVDVSLSPDMDRVSMDFTTFREQRASERAIN